MPSYFSNLSFSGLFHCPQRHREARRSRGSLFTCKPGLQGPRRRSSGGIQVDVLSGQLHVLLTQWPPVCPPSGVPGIGATCTVDHPLVGTTSRPGGSPSPAALEFLLPGQGLGRGQELSTRSKGSLVLPRPREGQREARHRGWYGASDVGTTSHPET